MAVPLLIILMWAGMLWSRALLSMAMMAFFLLTVVSGFKEGREALKGSWWMKLMILLFVIPAITGFWSQDISQWSRSVQVKLPLLFMPLAIPVFRSMDRRMRMALLFTLCGFIVLSSFYSYWCYFSTPGMDELYLKAKVLPVAMSNDHVRYAWLLVIGYTWLLYSLLKGGIGGRMKMVGYAVLIYIAVFIHVLAAKTGLIGFYLVTAMAILTMVPLRFRFASIILVISIPLIGWFLLPSFQNRLKFVVWDFQNYSRDNYTEGLSDGPRILSYKAGSEIFVQHPLTGVGSGDVLSETWKWYDVNAGFLKNYERLLPSNEVLLYACAGGILAALACLVAMLYPFFMKNIRGNMLWFCFHAVSVMGFMYEIGLEVQHGVFLYGFFSCWFYSMLSPAAEVEAV
jgi:hypothetical protein